jgi:hypothetical protein
MNKKTRKLWGLKIGGVQRGKKNTHTHFVSWITYFSSCYDFNIPFPLDFKDDF